MHSCFETQNTVSYTLKRYNEHKTVLDLNRCGRKKISTPRDQRNLIRMAKQQRKLSSEKLALQWNLSNGASASPSLVRKILQEHDMLWRRTCLKPRLTDRHKKQRLEFCNQYKNWSKYGWRDVLFSDEMNIEVDSRKCKAMLRRTIDF